MIRNKYTKKQKNKYIKKIEYYKNKWNMLQILENQNNSNFKEKFELLNYINSGSAGVVYEGFYRKNRNKHVCFKFIINKSYENRKEKNYDKDKDINIQKKLKNKNIIEYYEYIDLKNISCITMEFAKYGDLDNFRKILNKTRHFSETLLAFIAFQILNGLQFIHESEIIHMDIKPQNILFDENLNIKITDFSISLSYKISDKNSKKINLPLSGTCLYMSPEVLSHESVDYEECNKIDIFSFGVVLYNLAFDEFPYGLDYSYVNQFDLILNKIRYENLIIPERRNYSLLFKNFLLSLLNKNIKNRINIYEALEHPWIEGAKTLFKEKEKIRDLEKFLLNLVTDNVRSFNDYIKNYNNINGING